MEESTFVGSFERLRLRLPPLPGVRPITPVAPFGGDFVLVDASRSQHQTRRFPLKAGDDVWVGVRRIHALVHPGLSLLLLTDGTEAAEKAVLLGGEIARMARARVTILAHGLDETRGQEHLQRLREAIRGGLAAIESRVAPGTLMDAVTEEDGRAGITTSS